MPPFDFTASVLQGGADQRRGGLGLQWPPLVVSFDSWLRREILQSEEGCAGANAAFVRRTGRAPSPMRDRQAQRARS